MRQAPGRGLQHLRAGPERYTKCSCAYSTPRISLVGSKCAVRTRVRCLRWCVRGVCGTGGVPGWVLGGWYTGYHTGLGTPPPSGYGLPLDVQAPRSSPVPALGAFPGESLGGLSGVRGGVTAVGRQGGCLEGSHSPTAGRPR